MQVSAITADEKRAALHDLLQSVTLRRAEQLRTFLRYVVEEEIEGRGAQIREWDIAVKALNRPPSYSPETDSIVRTRAHSLRQRLEEYYRIEAPHAEVRIELPKGGYTPRFVRAHDVIAEPVATPPPEEPVRIPPSLPPEPSSAAPRARWLWALGGAVAAVLMCVAIAWILYERGMLAMKESPRPAEMAEVWGPIFAAAEPVKIVMSSPYQLWVRDYRTDPPPVVDPVYTPPMPHDPLLLKSYGESVPLLPDSKLYLHGNSQGALWGDAAGVQVATRFLTEQGVKTEFVPEKSLKSAYVLRNDSFLAFGRSEYSPLMSGKIPQNGFDVMYIPSLRRHGIALKSNAEGGPKYIPSAGTPAVNYGLITIIRDNAGDGQLRQGMLFAGVISNGAQAGIEFMTTPRHVSTLVGKLRAAGVKNWPRVMQVVVRSDTTEFYPIRTEYETHVVLQQ